MKKKQLKPEPYMMNRELSWLKFNERVLNEAGNPRVPLAERLTFASIYQSNLDEFYMVRVGTLMDQMESSEVVRENKTNMTSKEQVKAIIDATRELDIKKAVIYEQLMGELEPQGIRIINFNKLSGKEGELLETYFDNEIAPYLSANIMILSRLVDTFFSRISPTMQLPPKHHSIAYVLPWAEGLHWQSRSSGCSNS